MLLRVLFILMYAGSDVRTQLNGGHRLGAGFCLEPQAAAWQCWKENRARTRVRVMFWDHYVVAASERLSVMGVKCMGALCVCDCV